MDVDEIADMVTECCDTPDATTCEEAGHLRNQAWLCRNNLVNGNAVARFDLVALRMDPDFFPFTLQGRRWAVPNWQATQSGNFDLQSRNPGKVSKLGEKEDLRERKMI